MKLIKILKIDADKRLDKFLCEKFDVSFGLAQKMVRQKKVKVNAVRVDANYKLVLGDEVTLFTDLVDRVVKQTKKAFLSIDRVKKFESYIIYEDDNLVALDKPGGLAVQGGSGVKISVDDFAKYKKWSLVHRLDKDTSGVLLLAKNEMAAKELIAGFRNKNIKKIYQAYISGFLNKDEGVIEIPLKKKGVKGIEKVYPDLEDGKEAITKFKVLDKFRDYSLVELEPITGRTHQLRVHMKEMGCAIINDVKYGGRKVLKKELCNNLCLHAKEIKIGSLIIKSKLTLGA
ncbi:MAG: RluA family pseudouridine synthase [Rickettsiales bacterium]|nr:RluA family pseudouridine synthase [Rickettsiales bacterium]